MRLSVVQTALALAALVAAEPVLNQPPTKVKRDLATVTSVMAQVSASIVAVDNTVKAFTSDPFDVDTAAVSLIIVLQDGANTITASTPLTLSDAIGLTDSVTAIQTASEALVDSLTAKKSAFEQIGHCAVVQAGVQAIGVASKALIDATVSKVPVAAQPIAIELAKGINEALARGEAAYATCNDNTGTTSSSSSASSAAPTSTAVTSTTTSSQSSTFVTSTTSLPPVDTTTTSTIPPATTTTRLPCGRGRPTQKQH